MERSEIMSLHRKTLLKGIKEVNEWEDILYSWIERLTLVDSMDSSQFQ